MDGCRVILGDTGLEVWCPLPANPDVELDLFSYLKRELELQTDIIQLTWQGKALAPTEKLERGAVYILSLADAGNGLPPELMPQGSVDLHPINTGSSGTVEFVWAGVHEFNVTVKLDYRIQRMSTRLQDYEMERRYNISKITYDAPFAKRLDDEGRTGGLFMTLQIISGSVPTETKRQMLNLYEHHQKVHVIDRFAPGLSLCIFWSSKYETIAGLLHTPGYFHRLASEELHKMDISNKLKLVLDLDQTFIQTIESAQLQGEVMSLYQAALKEGRVLDLKDSRYTFVRKGFIEVLLHLLPYYDVYYCTMGASDYGRKVIQLLHDRVDSYRPLPRSRGETWSLSQHDKIRLKDAFNVSRLVSARRTKDGNTAVDVKSLSLVFLSGIATDQPCSRDQLLFHVVIVDDKRDAWITEEHDAVLAIAPQTLTSAGKRMANLQGTLMGIYKSVFQLALQPNGQTTASRNQPKTRPLDHFRTVH